MKVLDGLLSRIAAKIKDDIIFNITEKGEKDYYKITFKDKLYIEGRNAVSCAHGFYEYLKNVCNCNYSWNGNRDIKVDNLQPFEGEMYQTIDQKYRVYMNYCTIGYSMCWWDFDRWEKELDFMALNGINMPLAVLGNEAVVYETLIELGYNKKEALSEISGIAFYPWQLMTNIDGYIPPKKASYVYHRLELGKKVLNRMIEYGMIPIQQGFSGHVPMNFKDKYPSAKVTVKNGWCQFAKTAQLDPLDPMFQKYGKIYLEKQKTLLGSYHYYACDPFHENAPPKVWPWYLTKVGKAIDKLYKDFDNQSVWVMQSWSLRKKIVKAVPKDRLLILDLNSQKGEQYKGFWGYSFVAGILHNFGGKNALQGKPHAYAKNVYKSFKEKGYNVVGSGLFMEGIEQNPFIYDLIFDIITKDKEIDLDAFTKDYITRRYKIFDEDICNAYKIFLKTCYGEKSLKDNEVGSTICARPSLNPQKASPCDNLKVFYDRDEFVKGLKGFAKAELESSDGFQFDLCDFTRQALSNKFNIQHNEFVKSFEENDLTKAEKIAEMQLELLLDLDNLLSHRSEVCLARWIEDAHKLAKDDYEKKYFDLNARMLITLWGDIDTTSALYDYAWKEWSGLIKEYYYIRWQIFYKKVIEYKKKGEVLRTEGGAQYFGRSGLCGSEFGKELAVFEKAWVKTYSEYPYPQDKNVIPFAKELIEKWL